MLRKHASMPIIEVDDHQGKSSVLMKEAARANFEYTPEPGYIYVRSRMISSRCNDNFDEFPAEEIKKAYKTFIGKPVFVNHHNADHRRARGVIVDVALHEHVNPDGSPDVWVEGLMAIDAITYPMLAESIIRGEIDRTSMGCDVAFSICSACGNKATSPAEYCVHIPGQKGKKHYRYTASGEKVGEVIRERCYGLSFFENSLLVEPPADPTAYFLGVDTRGLNTASKNPRDDNPLFKKDDDDTTRASQDRPQDHDDPRLISSRASAQEAPQNRSDNRRGQQKAPPEVDTLRDEDCPVCGNRDFFSGDRCQVCGFTLPPIEFRDPDVTLHKKLDLRSDQGDIPEDGQLVNVDQSGAIDEDLMDPSRLDDDGELSDDETMLVCPHCGFRIESSPPMTKTDPDAGSQGLTVGDLCPDCEEAELATLKELEDLAADEIEEEENRASDEDGNDNAVKDENSEPKRQRKSSSRKVNPMTDSRIDELMRRVAILETQNEYLASLAGVTDEYETIRTHAENLLKEADINNPASPVPDPPSEPPSQTTEEALAPETSDDPQALGITPGSTQDVPADQVDTALRPGMTMPTSPTNDLQDVTAPVAGTETHVPEEQTRIESEVRVGDPDNPQPAFPWHIGSNDGATRAIASMRLAELRIEAGLEQGDKYEIAGKIQSSASNTEAITQEIDTLTNVIKATSRRRTLDSVPKISSEARQAPSLNDPTFSATASRHNDDVMELFL